MRLLDDFLGQEERPYPTDVLSKDWPPGSSKPKSFLSPDIRKRINKQLAHLSSDREWGYEWPLAKMTTDCCRALAQFFDAVEPERRAAFRESQALVDEWLRGGRPGGTHPSIAHSESSVSTAPATIADSAAVFVLGDPDEYKMRSHPDDGERR